jgi:uncharacterized protein with GYD domain
MPRYILLSTLTHEGIKTVKDRPYRIQEVNKEIEVYGVKVVDQYAVLGPFDFVTILEAPDNQTVAKVSIDLSARGTIKITSMPATPTDEFVASLE